MNGLRGPERTNESPVNRLAEALADLCQLVLQRAMESTKAEAAGLADPAKTGGLNEPLMLTVVEAAKQLQISSKVAYQLVAQGVIPSFRITDDAIRIPREGLLEWSRLIPRLPPEERTAPGIQRAWEEHRKLWLTAWRQGGARDPR